jgi:hypothetical protein
MPGTPTEPRLAGDKGEPLYALPADLRTLDAVRGSILFLDWTWLRSHGHYDAYAARVEAPYRDTLLGAATSDWVPLEPLLAHYRALDGMKLSHQEAMDVGRLVGERAHGALLSTILRLAGGLGATPWLALGQAHKMWERTWRGGGIAIHRIHDRAARAESIGNPCAVSPFFRSSFSGAFAIGLASLCKASRIEEIERARTPDSFALTVEWA